MTRHLLRLICLALALSIATGCGDGSSNDDRAAGNAGALEHADGTIATKGSSFTLAPHGGEPRTFRTGPNVEGAAVQALAASGAVARVTWRATEPSVAVAVALAPKVGTGSRSVVGTIVKVSSTSITITGAAGKHTYSIAARDRAAFDVEHLREHQHERSPIRVYLDPDNADTAVAYEDA